MSANGDFFDEVQIYFSIENITLTDLYENIRQSNILGIFQTPINSLIFSSLHIAKIISAFFDIAVHDGDLIDNIRLDINQPANVTKTELDWALDYDKKNK